MRSLISWPWCFVRHAFLGGNHPNCPGLIRQSPTFTSLSKRTSFERPRRHSDFTMRERPTLRLDFTITLFFLRDTFHFRLCCLCCLWCLCADHGYFFLFFTFVACLQYLVFLRQKRWYNVIWLFWIVILVRNGVWMELRKFDGALFLWIVKSILKVNYPIFRSFLLCGCGKRKREKGIYVDARWFRHAPAFLDTQKGIICSTRATWASSFLPEWKINGANTTPANGKKKFTKSNWDKGYTQRTPWPSVRIGHYMLDDLAAAGSGISRAVSDQTKQRRWIGRGKNKKTILSISVKERKKSVLCYLDGALDPMTHRPAHRSDVGSTFSCIYYRLGRSLQVLAATGKQIPVQCRLGMWAS